MKNTIPQVLVVILMSLMFYSHSFQRWSVGLCRTCRPMRRLVSAQPEDHSNGPIAPLRRFWAKETCINATDRTSAISSVAKLIDSSVSGCVRKQVIENGNIGQAEHGLVIIPDFDLIVPVQDGVMQQQHAASLGMGMKLSGQTVDGTIRAILCGFSSRAQTLHEEVLNRDRPMNPERKEALDRAMEQVGLDITGDELLSGEYLGTPVSRMYRSFVCPRPPKEGTKRGFVESTERYAERVADQINFAVRQMRADRASYLRNTDRSSPTGSTATEGAGRTISATESPVETGSDFVSDVSSQRAATTHPVVLVLDSLRSAENVGSIFRSAETAGVAEVITCGFTPHPPHPKVSKTALQSAELVKTRHFLDPLEAVRALKADGYTIVVMETTSLSQRYTAVQYPKKVAFVLGNEVFGVDTRIVELADMVVEIPTYGIKNSLNVASAASVVLFEVLRQWHD